LAADLLVENIVIEAVAALDLDFRGGRAVALQRRHGKTLAIGDLVLRRKGRSATEHGKSEGNPQSNHVVIPKMIKPKMTKQ